MIRILLVALAVAGCAPVAAPSSGSAEPLSIRYETTPCFGSCPVYAVTVSSDGQGEFVGKRFTAVSGPRKFTVTRAQFDDFAAALAAERPNGEAIYQPGTPLCPNAATDQSSVNIVWTQGSRSDHLNFYFGCGMGKRAAFSTAVTTLPIADMVGPREPFRGQR